MSQMFGVSTGHLLGMVETTAVYCDKFSGHFVSEKRAYRITAGCVRVLLVMYPKLLIKEILFLALWFLANTL